MSIKGDHKMAKRSVQLAQLAQQAQPAQPAQPAQQVQKKTRKKPTEEDKAKRREEQKQATTKTIGLMVEISTSLKSLNLNELSTMLDLRSLQSDFLVLQNEIKKVQHGLTKGCFEEVALSLNKEIDESWKKLEQALRSK